MDNKKRQFIEGFKKETVGRSLSSIKTAEEVARDLGISHHNLRRWCFQYRKGGERAFPDHGKESLTP
jgi:transposase